VIPPGSEGPDGVRLLSHRPSVLFKVEHHGDTADPGDLAGEGVLISGPGWGERLRDALAALSHAERACLFAVRLDDRLGLPLPATTLLERARTDWFAKFLSQGQLVPVFQPIVDLREGTVYGREALMRGKMGRIELRGAELFHAAEVHDALFSFDARSRIAALEAGLGQLPPGEVLFVNIDPRAVLDIDSSLRSVWPVVEREDGQGARIGLSVVHAERYPDPDVLERIVEAHRSHGAVVSLSDVAAGGASLRVLERLRPDVVKLERALVKDIEASAGRRRLVGALVDVAHELGTRVVAVGIERDSELEALVDLDVDYGQGFYLAQPTAEMLPVEARIPRRTLV
jgi:EAL domain-containing protein (putative c-di-GMP-specific phosphodiesterase class I)